MISTIAKEKSSGCSRYSFAGALTGVILGDFGRSWVLEDSRQCRLRHICALRRAGIFFKGKKTFLAFPHPIYRPASKFLIFPPFKFLLFFFRGTVLTSHDLSGQVIVKCNSQIDCWLDFCWLWLTLLTSQWLVQHCETFFALYIFSHNHNLRPQFRRAYVMARVTPEPGSVYLPIECPTWKKNPVH